jgi:hypothetical protein
VRLERLGQIREPDQGARLRVIRLARRHGELPDLPVEGEHVIALRFERPDQRGSPLAFLGTPAQARLRVRGHGIRRPACSSLEARRCLSHGGADGLQLVPSWILGAFGGVPYGGLRRRGRDERSGRRGNDCRGPGQQTLARVGLRRAFDRRCSAHQLFDRLIAGGQGRGCSAVDSDESRARRRVDSEQIPELAALLYQDVLEVIALRELEGGLAVAQAHDDNGELVAELSLPVRDGGKQRVAGSAVGIDEDKEDRPLASEHLPQGRVRSDVGVERESGQLRSDLDPRGASIRELVDAGQRTPVTAQEHDHETRLSDCRERDEVEQADRRGGRHRDQECDRRES